MSKTLCLYHIVFATKERRSTLPLVHKRDLYAYIFGILHERNCWVERINGMTDHIHIALNLNPNISLSELVKSLKQGSSLWMKGQDRFRYFEGWGKGYYAYTYGVEQRDAVRQYIANQEVHHIGEEFIDEVMAIARKHDFQWYDDDWK